MRENMNTPTLTKLLAERLNELGCGEIPTPVRAQLEDEIATKWADEAPRLVAETATPKRVALAFAAHLGVRQENEPN